MNEANAFGDAQVFRAVPTGVVELQHDPLVWSCAHRPGEIGEHEFEHLLADAVRDVPHGGSGRGLDETRQVEPFEAVMPERDRTLADGRPHAARDRLQADTVLVRRPDLDAGVRMFLAFARDRVLEFFLKLTRSASPADSG